MKLCFIILLLFFLGSGAMAQDKKSDEVSVAGTEKIDSLQNAFYKQSDSLRQSYTNSFYKIDSVHQRLKVKLDSVSSTRFLLIKKLSGNKADSLEAHWRSRVDSLSLVNDQFSAVTQALDSINNLRDETLATMDSKLQGLKDKTVGKLNEMDLPPQLAGKATEATSQINEFQIPDSQMDALHLPGVKTDLNLPGVTHDTGLGKAGALGDVKDLTGKVGAYGQDVQALATGNVGDLNELPGAAEAKAGELAGVGDLAGQTDALNEYKDLSGKMQNPDSLKALAVQEVKQMAVNHFAGKEEQLKEAMATIAKYKSKYSSVNSISEITKRPPNEMKGKPLIERIIPGIGFQIQKKGEDLLVDFNPYAGYRFTGRLMAGVGWNQRVAYNLDRGVFHPEARVFGPRIFSEFKLWRGFSPRVELEVMNTNVPPITRAPSVDPLAREWVWGAFAGVKKEYKFIKNVKGTAIVMMRLFNPDHKSPYADVVNVRFGFEFPMKKKARKS